MLGERQGVLQIGGRPTGTPFLGRWFLHELGISATNRTRQDGDNLLGAHLKPPSVVDLGAVGFNIGSRFE